jgi:hypothetical protein
MSRTPTSSAGQQGPSRQRAATILYLRAQVEVARDRGDDVTSASYTAALADLTPRTSDRTRTRTIAVIGGGR